MQNQSYLNCKIEYCPVEPPEDFPVTALEGKTYSPPSDQVSYMHYHNIFELGYCYEGCGLFFINDRIVPFSAGDASVIYKDEIHIAQSNKSTPCHWKFIFLDPLKLLKELDVKNIALISALLEKNQTGINLFGKDDVYGINEVIQKLFIELENKERDFESMSKALVWALMVKLTRIAPSLDSEYSKDFHQNLAKISPALNFIAGNYSGIVTLEMLAQKCNMSSAHFRRIFCRAMQIPPSEYLYMVRIKMAAILLMNSNDSILEIAYNVGYTTLSGFNRHFRRIMGISPSEWKKQHIKTPC